MEDRRRHGVGLDLLRSRARPDLLRHAQSRTVESRAAARRQQVDHRRSSRATRTPARRCWAYQISPHDLFDYDEVNELVLVDLPIGDRTRKVLDARRSQRLLYVIDRATGEVLSADAVRLRQLDRGVDLKTGRLIPVEEKTPHQGVVVRDICPAAPGMKDWQPTAFSPRTGLLYIPHQNLCMKTSKAMATSYIAGTPYVGANVVDMCRPRRTPRRVHGLGSGRRPRRRGSIKETFPVWSGTVVTAGDVVFYGTMDGWFKAVDAQNRRRCCGSSSAGSGIIGQPIIYKGPDGHAVRRGPVGRRRLGRRHRQRRARSARRDCAATASVNATGGSEVGDDAGRHALRLRARRRAVMRAPAAVAWPSLASTVAAAGCSVARRPSRALRVCADPNNLPFSNAPARASRTRSPSCSRPIGTRHSNTPGGRSGAGSCATR